MKTQQTPTCKHKNREWRGPNWTCIECGHVKRQANVELDGVKFKIKPTTAAPRKLSMGERYADIIAEDRSQNTCGYENNPVPLKQLTAADAPAQPQHSPLPWNEGPDFTIKASNGDYVCIMDASEGKRWVHDRELIVKTCNAYPELQREHDHYKAHAEALAEACQSVVETWEQGFKGQETGYEGTPLEADYKQCKAALADWKAREQ